MARELIEVITSDLSSEPGATTLSFTYEGEVYEIDLTEGEKAELEAKYIANARPVTPEQAPSDADLPARAEPAGAGKRPSSRPVKEPASTGRPQAAPARKKAGQKKPLTWEELVDLTRADDPAQRETIRKWGLANGFRNTHKGRISKGLLKAYLEANGPTAGEKPKATRRAAPASSVEQNKAIRQWARAHGYDVAETGRIPADILREFHASAQVAATDQSQAEPGKDEPASAAGADQIFSHQPGG